MHIDAKRPMSIWALGRFFTFRSQQKYISTALLLRQIKEDEIEKKFWDAMPKEKAHFVAGKWKERTVGRRAAKQEVERIQEELKVGQRQCVFLWEGSVGQGQSDGDLWL